MGKCCKDDGAFDLVHATAHLVLIRSFWNQLGQAQNIRWVWNWVALHYLLWSLLPLIADSPYLTVWAGWVSCQQPLLIGLLAYMVVYKTLQGVQQTLCITAFTLCLKRHNIRIFKLLWLEVFNTIFLHYHLRLTEPLNYLETHYWQFPQTYCLKTTNC